MPVGSIFLLYAYLSIYLIALLGLGLLISTFAETQQQAMSIAFFFIMIFMLMSGFGIIRKRVKTNTQAQTFANRYKPMHQTKIAKE